VAGLSEDNTPFLSGMDLIGAPVFTKDFVVSGTCTQNLHGMCEALYKPLLVGHVTPREDNWLRILSCGYVLHVGTG
jgi:hypothetical protein